jgi:hypothetical protein
MLFIAVLNATYFVSSFLSFYVVMCSESRVLSRTRLFMYFCAYITGEKLKQWK